MARYVWNDRLKQSIRFSYWNELCVTDDKGALAPQPADKPARQASNFYALSDAASSSPAL